MRPRHLLIGTLVFWLIGIVHADECHVASYRLVDGRSLDIGPTADAQLRWRLEDGRSGKLTRRNGEWLSTLGWTDRPDGRRVILGSCESGELSFDGVRGLRTTLRVIETRFAANGAELAGRLLMPEGNQPVPVVVLVHGSESTSARQFFSLQREFPAAGIAAFVYDKRGTGGSTGQYTHDYRQLATDAALAVAEARRLAGARATRVGLHGSSQGGWVAPLAATKTRVDFVIVAFGLAVSPLDEDREAVAWDMARHGFGATETPKALEVAHAAEIIIKSGFEQGWAGLRQLREQYSSEPWFRYLRGNVTGLLLAESEEFWRTQGPALFAGLLPDYDPMPVLRQLRVPQLWILGADDIDAPPQETWRRLLALRRDGRPLSLVMIPRAEHGLYEYELDGKGNRVSTRLPPAYLPLMRDFVLDGSIAPAYFDSLVVRPAR